MRDTNPKLLRLVSQIIRRKLYEDITDEEFNRFKKQALVVAQSYKKQVDDRIEMLEKADKKKLMSYFKGLVDDYGVKAKSSTWRTGDKIEKAKKAVEKYKDGIPKDKSYSEVKDELVKAGFKAYNIEGRSRANLEREIKRTARDFSIKKLEEEWGFGEDASVASKELRELAVNTMSMIKT